MEVNKKSALESARFFSVTSLATQLVTIVAAILSRRFLGPAQMGIWAIIQVIISYTKYSNFGVSQAMLREIPYQIGKGDLDKANTIKNTTFSLVFITGTILAFGFLCVAWIWKTSLKPEFFYGLLFSSVFVILIRINNMLQDFLKCFKHFDRLGKQALYSAFVNAIFVAGFSYYFQIYGFMTAMILSFIFNIAYMLYYQKFHFKWATVSTI